MSDGNNDEQGKPVSKNDVLKWEEMFPGLPPEDELREKMRRIKTELEEGFERLKREQNR